MLIRSKINTLIIIGKVKSVILMNKLVLEILNFYHRDIARIVSEFQNNKQNNFKLNFRQMMTRYLCISQLLIK